MCQSKNVNKPTEFNSTVYLARLPKGLKKNGKNFNDFYCKRRSSETVLVHPQNEDPVLNNDNTEDTLKKLSMGFQGAINLENMKLNLKQKLEQLEKESLEKSRKQSQVEEVDIMKNLKEKNEAMEMKKREKKEKSKQIKCLSNKKKIDSNLLLSRPKTGL